MNSISVARRIDLSDFFRFSTCLSDVPKTQEKPDENMNLLSNGVFGVCKVSIKIA